MKLPLLSWIIDLLLSNYLFINLKIPARMTNLFSKRCFGAWYEMFGISVFLYITQKQFTTLQMRTGSWSTSDDWSLLKHHFHVSFVDTSHRHLRSKWLNKTKLGSTWNTFLSLKYSLSYITFISKYDLSIGPVLW